MFTAPELLTVRQEPITCVVRLFAAEFTMFEGTTRWCHSKKFGSFDQFRIGVDVFRSKEEAERRVFTLIENRLKKLRAEIETLEMMRLEVGKA